ncbi:MAG: 2-amino-4-hydroxy-6-hydroxymethyldihydropteridine diphosphokinase [Candidatus Melainabacteria bacterium GWF2_37_15]|nr:MAG: 2-amino-4-hydroxy-6-hydroxymethyldihydropteridine diphosphokinase [Candidatus Melainabacteria bacterium GWF2_37_15]
MNTAFICAGSNLGDRVGYLQQANNLLNYTEGITVIMSSSLYESEPVGYKDQEWFVNAVLHIETTFTPLELLEVCMRIEKQLGRVRDLENQWGERTLDLDILFYDNKIINEDSLQIPHPRVHERAYALVPMLEIDPDFVHPKLKKTICEMHSELEEPEEVYLYGTRSMDF